MRPTTDTTSEYCPLEEMACFMYNECSTVYGNDGLLARNTTEGKTACMN